MLGAGILDTIRKAVMSESLAAVPNLRDLGGHEAADGRRVVAGRVYRSTELGRLTPEGAAALAGLGLTRVFDLRTAGERTASPDQLPAGTAHTELDVLADKGDAVPAQLNDLFAHVSETAAALGDGTAARALRATYRDFVLLDSAQTAYRGLFSGLIQAAGHPVLFHCTTGKDRTGWAAASLLTLLGVPEDEVMADYLRTNDDLLPALQPLFDTFERAGGDPGLLRPVLGVQPDYLDTAFAAVRERYGSVEGYFAGALGIGPDGQDALRGALLTEATARG